MNCPTGRTAQQLELMKTQKELQHCKLKLINYEKAYDILMEYFDCIPEAEREEVSKRLDKCGV